VLFIYRVHSLLSTESKVAAIVEVENALCLVEQMEQTETRVQAYDADRMPIAYPVLCTPAHADIGQLMI
jgi:hypothetical protein